MAAARSDWERQPNANVLKRPDLRPSPQHRLVQVFLNVDLRQGHPGLAELAKEHHIEVEHLEDGQYLLFINTKMSMLKMFTSNFVIAVYKSPTGRLDLGVVERIPQSFRGESGFDLDEALREVLLDILTKKPRRVQAVREERPFPTHPEQVEVNRPTE